MLRFFVTAPQQLIPSVNDFEEQVLINIFQGYEVPQEDINMSLDEFRSRICDSMGEPQYVTSVYYIYEASSIFYSFLVLTMI